MEQQLLVKTKNTSKMKKIIILSILLAYLQAQGQTSLQRPSINANGGTAAVSNFYVSCSIGEPIAATIQSNNLTLTQGFQQLDRRPTQANLVAPVFTANGNAEVEGIKLIWVENMAELGDSFKIEKKVGEQFEWLQTKAAVQGADLKSYAIQDSKPEDSINTYKITLLKNDVSLMQKSVEVKVKYLKPIYASISPNPTDTYVQVQLLESSNADKIVRLYNALGHQVLEKATDALQSIQLDVSNLPIGLYVLRISQKGKRDFSKQLIIQR